MSKRRKELEKKRKRREERNEEREEDIDNFELQKQQQIISKNLMLKQQNKGNSKKKQIEEDSEEQNDNESESDGGIEGENDENEIIYDNNNEKNENGENNKNEKQQGKTEIWKRLPTLEEEREEQAKERMIKQAQVELRLKTEINNEKGLLRKLSQICSKDSSCSRLFEIYPENSKLQNNSSKISTTNSSLENKKVEQEESSPLSPLTPSFSSTNNKQTNEKEDNEEDNEREAEGQNWLKYQMILSSKETSKEISNVEDDFQRELAFYNQSKEAVEQSWKLLKEFKVKHSRPEDYFAEMLKSDYQMSNVRGRLIREKRELEAKEQRRQQRMSKKIGKQTQQQKQQEKQQQKKKTQVLLDKWKKKSKVEKEKISLDEILDEKSYKSNKRKLGINDQEDDERNFNNKTFESNKKRKTELKTPGKKRQYKNSKFGFGGKKDKRNNSTSAEDFSKDFFNTQKKSSGNKNGNKSFGGKNANPRKSKSEKKRPGKTSRRKSR